MFNEIGFRHYAQNPTMLGNREVAPSSGFSTQTCLPWKAQTVYTLPSA